MSLELLALLFGAIVLIILFVIVVVVAVLAVSHQVVDKALDIKNQAVIDEHLRQADNFIAKYNSRRPFTARDEAARMARTAMLEDRKRRLDQIIQEEPSNTKAQEILDNLDKLEP
jgi:cytochrome c556